jgi:hypothetical protein
LSVCWLTQAPTPPSPAEVQKFWPVGHAHEPFMQGWPAGQRLPQRPQLALSERGLTHAPAPASFEAQKICPAVAHAHTPRSRGPASADTPPSRPEVEPGAAMQRLGAMQSIPQPPQFALSLAGSTQRLLQTICPAGQR